MRLLFIAAFVVFVAWLLGSSYIFRFEFQNGAVRDIKGVAPGPLRQAFEEVARHGGVSGTVSLYPGRFLRFSRGVSPEDQQRFRNVMASML